jgi:predicted ATPase
MIGRILNERYRLDAELGQGGMGVVYRAHDTLLDRAVAVKVVSKASLGTEGRARLMHEARAAAQLNHPNVVSVFDAGESEGLPFIVMELVEGQTLHQRRPTELDEIVSYARQICAALEHAHAHGIIHRDLKPENVQIALDGTAKLTDFGLARSVASRITSEGTIVGSVFYLAPELALGQEYDGRADLYALGVMLYELTTGRLPFAADDPVAVISQHLHAPVVPPRARNAEIPPALDALIVRLLEKSPQDRPTSAAEVLRALEQPGLLDKDALPARELSVLERIERGRLVGRDRELQQARALWSRALSGQGQMLLISGEPGIGKTRLMRELVTHVEVSGNRALVGQCYSEGGAPYAPFAQILRAGLDGGSGEGLDLPDFVLADLITLAPELRLHYPGVQPNPLLDPESEQQRLFENMVAFCRALSERAPLLLVLEDAHWADSGTLSLLRHLARRTGRQRLMLAATYREVELDETRPFRQAQADLFRERLATRLKLSRLDREQTRDMLAALFAEEITAEFLDGIHRETEGNPFFIEEVCKALVESGEVFYQDGHWDRPSMDELEIPQSVRVAIQSRVGKLPTQVQDTLRLAAILGREFDFDTLAAASELDEDALIEALESAEGAQLIEELSGRGGVTFAFPHALIAATLVEGVRTLRRRRLHRRGAAAIEGLRPDDFEALAYHHAEAGNAEQALTYYTRAGERASAAYANQEAERHFRAALDLAHSETKRAHLLSELGVVLARLSQHEEAIETWRKGIALYRSLGQQEGIARLYARSARAAWHAGDTPRGLALCREGVAAVAGAPDSPEMANLLHETARACWFNGLPDEAIPLCHQALEMAERLGSVRVQAEALTTLGVFPGQQAEEALSALTRAVELAESAGLVRQASRAHNNLAVRLGLSDLQAARSHFLQAAELERQRGAVVSQLFSSSNAISMAVIQGDFAAAEAELRSMRQLLDTIHNPRQAISQYGMTEALFLRYRGEVTRAIELLRPLQAEWRAVGDLQILAIADNNLADALLEVGEKEEAEVALREAISIGDQGIGYGGVVPRCMLLVHHARQGEIEKARRLLSEAREKAIDAGSWAIDLYFLSWAEAHVAAAEGHWSEALSALHAAADGSARSGARWYWARVLWERGEVHLLRGGRGDRERARELLHEAKAEFEGMGVPIYAAQLKERLKQIEGQP